MRENKFIKYCPNVWVAECYEKHLKGDTILITTQYGKEVECKVYNLIKTIDEKYFYSIVRIEDLTYAERKAQRYKNSAQNYESKSAERYNAAQEGREFLSLGEPIKIGHHSEKRHRALIERNFQRMGKSIEFDFKAKNMEEKAEYWENKSKEITLAMPESLKYFTEKLSKAIAYHKGLKEGTVEREHSYSVVYANKEVKDLSKKIEIAKLLWGEV